MQEINVAKSLRPYVSNPVHEGTRIARSARLIRSELLAELKLTRSVNYFIGRDHTLVQSAGRG